MNRHWERYVMPASALVALMLVGLYLWSARHYINDDGFIHARIARNLVETGHASFNLNSSANASSSPLFTLLSATLFLLCGPSLWIVGLWNAAMVVLLGLLLFRGVTGPWSMRGVVALLGMLLVLPSAGDLMETPTALVLLVSGVFALQVRPSRAVLFITLATFTRPECGVLLALSLAWIGIKNRRALVPALAMGAMVALPIMAWLYLQFGSLIPQSIVAKSIVYQISTREFWDHLFLSVFGDEDRSYLALGIASLLGVLSIIRRKQLPIDLVILLCTGVMLTVAAYRARLVFFFPWYAPLITVPVLLSFASIASRAGKQYLISALCLVAVIPLAWPLLLESKELVKGTSNSAAMKWGARVQSYRILGSALQRSYPSATVMMAEIGGFGWEFQGTVLDGAGLATPEALTYHPMQVPKERVSGSIGGIPLGFINQVQPDFVIGYPQFLKEFAQSSIAGMEYCQYDFGVFPKRERERMKSGSLWGNSHLFVYAKRTLLGAPLWSVCPWSEQVFGAEVAKELAL